MKLHFHMIEFDAVQTSFLLTLYCAKYLLYIEKNSIDFIKSWYDFINQGISNCCFFWLFVFNFWVNWLSRQECYFGIL